MGLFAWREEYSVGHAEIDREHKALFRIGEALETAMAEGKADDELTGLFARLVSYTRFHFANEEQLMRAIDYPDAEAHIREHNHLTARVAELERQFEQGKARVSDETLTFLRRWLDHHIRGTDKRFASHNSGA